MDAFNGLLDYIDSWLMSWTSRVESVLNEKQAQIKFLKKPCYLLINMDFVVISSG